MKLDKQVALAKIKEIVNSCDDAIEEGTNRVLHENVEEATFDTLSLLAVFYGDNSEYKKQILNLRETYVKHSRSSFYTYPLIDAIKAVLKTLRFEIDNNLIESLENQVRGEVIGDFLSLSKNLLNEGYKDSAAVLACGALEDTMKKFGEKKGLDVCDMELAAVINLLKSSGFIKGSQGAVVQSYVQLRNKAFHAQFDKIEIPEISSLISFLEQFLLLNFK